MEEGKERTVHIRIYLSSNMKVIYRLSLSVFSKKFYFYLTFQKQN